MRLFYIFLLGIVLGNYSNVSAQSAPIIISIDSDTVEQGDTVCLKIRAYNFTSVSDFQFSLKWDSEFLHYLSVNQSACPNSLTLSFGTSHVSEGYLIVLGSTAGQNLSDGSCLFQICFSIDFAGWGQHIIEEKVGYTEFYNDAGFTFPYLFEQGIVTINNPPPPLNLVWKETIPAGCRDIGGIVEIVVDGGAPPYHFQWSNAQSVIANTNNLKGVPPGVYYLMVQDQYGQVLQDTFAVASTLSPIDLRESVVHPATCGQPNGCINLLIKGGTAPFAMKWDDNPGASAERCDLDPGIYRVQVVDSAGCKARAGFSVIGLTGFTLDREKDKPACAQPGFITLLPSGGVPPYRAIWNTGDTTLTLANLEVGYYHATVTDATGCSTEKDIALHDNLFPLSFGWQGTYDCPLNGDDGSLKLYFGGLSDSDILPLTIEWNNGFIDTIWGNASNDTESTLQQIPAGMYHNVVRQANGCAFVGGMTVDCSLPPLWSDSDDADFTISHKKNDWGQYDSCVTVSCSGCQNVVELQGTLSWSSDIAQLREIRPNLQLGMYPGDFMVDTVLRSLSFTWHSSTGTGYNVQEIFEACFLPANDNVPAAWLSFTHLPVGPLVRGADGTERSVTAISDVVVFWDHFSEFEMFGGKISRAGCLTDGKREFCAIANIFGFIEYGIYPLEGQPAPIHEYYRGSGLEDGYYFIIASEPFWGADDALIFIPPSAKESCVWPGDTDNNGTVNHSDLLYLGLGYDQAGIPRTVQGNIWSGYSASGWPQKTPLRQVSFQNIDANGDGIIAEDDTLAIVTNWGLVADQASNTPYASPFLSPTDSAAAPLWIASNTAKSGISATLQLNWGTAAAKADDAYGLAFSLRYDTAVIHTNIRFEPDSSWFGNPDSGELLWIQRNFPQWGILSVAMTRIDKENVSGSGPIGRFLMVPKYIGSNDAVQTTLQLWKGLAISAQESPLPLHLPQAELNIVNPALPVIDAIQRDNIVIYPNPSDEILYIQTEKKPNGNVEFFNLLGQCIHSQTLAETGITITPVSTFSNGNYMLKLTTSKGVSSQKIIIQHAQ